MAKFGGRRYKLTKDFIEGLPFAGRDKRGRVEQRLFWDNKLTGFGLLVGLNSRSFVVQREIDGKSVRETIGRFGPRDWAVDQARKEAQQRLSALARGERKAKAAPITLEQAWTRIALPHLRKKQRSPVTLKVYEFNLQKHLSGWLHRPLASISRTEAREKHEEIAADHGAPSADMAMKVFSAAYNLALRENDLPVNPVVAVSYHEPNPPRTAIPLQKLPAWSAAVDSLSNAVKRDCLTFLLFSGLRKSSAMHLKWDDIDLELGVARIGVVKGDKPFSLPMSSQMVEVVKRRLAERDLYAAESHCAPWVFPSPSARSGHVEVLLSPSSNWVVHDLRRTFITVAEGLGISPFAIKTLVNHAQPSGITGGYMNLTPERLAPDMQRIGNAITAAIEGGSGKVVPIRQRTA